MKNRLAPASIGRASLHSFDKSCGPRMSQDEDEDDDEAIKMSHEGMTLEYWETSGYTRKQVMLPNQ